MVDENQSRKKYPSDLTDEQWAIVGPMIPPAKQNPRGGRPREVDMREVLNTLFYLDRSGCQWDMLPHDLLPKSTVFGYFSQWRDDGTLQRLMDALRERVRTSTAKPKVTPTAPDGVAANPALSEAAALAQPDQAEAPSALAGLVPQPLPPDSQ